MKQFLLFVWLGFGIAFVVNEASPLFVTPELKVTCWDRNKTIVYDKMVARITMSQIGGGEAATCIVTDTKAF
jgi:hypothetical protein